MRLDPRLRLSWLFTVGALVLLLDGPIGLSLIAVMSVGVVLLGDSGRASRRTLGLLMLGLFWSTALSQGLFYRGQPRTPLLELGSVSLSREGLLYGMVQALRWIAVGASGLWVALNTSADQLSASLVSLGLPRSVAFLMGTALRSLPLITSDLSIVRAARTHRRAFSPPGLRRLREEFALLRPWVARSLRRSASLADSLYVRGFSPADARGGHSIRPLLPIEKVALIGLLLGVSGLFFAKALYWLYLWDLAYWPALRPLYAAVRAYL